MAPADRRVRRLRLTARAEAEVRRMLPRLEDAMRCASLPDSGEQLFLIRKLALGRLPRDASPQTLALILERRVAATGGVWAEGGSVAAEAADFIRFASRFDARVELALRLVRGQPAREWYWRPAVPEYRPDASRFDNLRGIALAIAELPEAAAALPAWIARLVEAGGVAALLTAVPADLGRALADRLGLPGPARRCAPATLGSGPGAAERPIEPPIWLIRCLAAARPGHPSETPSPPPRLTSAEARPDPPTPPASPLAKLPAEPIPPGRGPAEVGDRAGRSHIEPARPVRPAAPPRVRADARPSSRRPPASLDRPAREAPKVRRDTSEPPLRPAAPPVHTEGAAPDPRPWLAPTAGGGLLFLLPLLARLDIADWCDRRGLEDLPARVLALAARRLRLAEDDPIRAAFPVRAGDPRRLPRPAPAVWADPLFAPPRGGGAGDLGAALAAARRLDDQAAVFLTAARRWLRRAARMGLADLVLRPARVGVSATHVDLHFRLADCDIRVRRAGLDLDPGWLPWFGRVVTFHYEAGET